MVPIKSLTFKIILTPTYRIQQLMIMRNSASNYKTYLVINENFTLTQLNIINSTLQRETFFSSDYNSFTSTKLVLRALMFTVSKQ